MDIGDPPEFRPDGSSPPREGPPAGVGWRCPEPLGDLIYALRLPTGRRGQANRTGTLRHRATVALIKGQTTFDLNPSLQKIRPEMKGLLQTAGIGGTVNYGSWLESYAHTAFVGYLRRARELLATSGLPATDEMARAAYDWPLEACYSRFWRRDDPVIQLPPGTNAEVASSIRTGLTAERSLEVARSLGASAKGLSPALSSKTSSKVAVLEERELSVKVSLANPLADAYRRFAVWHIVDRIEVRALAVGFDSVVPWLSEEVSVSGTATLTWTDVAT
jgi:hypothetical protein